MVGLRHGGGRLLYPIWGGGGSLTSKLDQYTHTHHAAQTGLSPSLHPRDSCAPSDWALLCPRAVVFVVASHQSFLHCSSSFSSCSSVSKGGGLQPSPPPRPPLFSGRTPAVASSCGQHRAPLLALTCRLLPGLRTTAGTSTPPT